MTPKPTETTPQSTKTSTELWQCKKICHEDMADTKTCDTPNKKEDKKCVSCKKERGKGDMAWNEDEEEIGKYTDVDTVAYTSAKET